MFSQSRLGVWVGAVTMETVSPLFKVYLIGTFFPFTFAETHLHPNLVWIAKAKSSTVAPLASLISSPVGVKTYISSLYKSILKSCIRSSGLFSFVSKAARTVFRNSSSPLSAFTPLYFQ